MTRRVHGCMQSSSLWRRPCACLTVPRAHVCCVVCAVLQRTSRDLDSTWRMQMVREAAAKRDVWKR
jgi:hypothetical protein